MTESIVLRPYQTAAIAATMQALLTHKSTLIEAATGTGKTRSGAEMVRIFVSEGRRVLWLAHRGELIDQAEQAMLDAGLSPGIEKAGRKAKDEPIVIASVQTMQNKRLARFVSDAFDVIIVDEAHHCPANGYQNIIRHFPRAKVIGVTATPDRADGVSLGLAFESCAYRYGIVQAVQEGYLVPPRAFQVVVEGMDLSKVRQKVITKGVAVKTPEEGWGELPPSTIGEVRDLHPGDLAKAALAPEAVEGVVGPLLELAEHRRTVVFAVSVEHAAAIATSINEKVPLAARYIHGGMPEHDRKAIIAAHKAGEFQYLCNCMLLCEGYDDPGIMCVAIARPTQSRILFAQICGRPLRLLGQTIQESIAAGKSEAMILDFPGVSCRFDLVGPEDVLAGAMVAPMRSLRKASTPVPVVMVPYMPQPLKVSFVSKLVDIVYRAGYAVGHAVGEGARVTYGAVRESGGVVAGWFARLFGGGR